LYQGQATITRPGGGQVAAEVTVWLDDTGVLPAWGGRGLVASPESLLDDIGTTCAIRWPAPGGALTVGAFVLGGGQVVGTVETFRMLGTGGLSTAPSVDSQTQTVAARIVQRPGVTVVANADGELRRQRRAAQDSRSASTASPGAGILL
jgi:hypothetical protein